jgi:hypothetical protein
MQTLWFARLLRPPQQDEGSVIVSACCIILSDFSRQKIQIILRTELAHQGSHTILRMCQNAIRSQKKTSVVNILVPRIDVPRVKLFVAQPDTQIFSSNFESQVSVDSAYLKAILPEDEGIAYRGPP